MNSESTIHGNVAPGFERVKEEFAAVAAAEGGSLSAQLAAYHNGKLVVDLWTGPEIQGDSLLGAGNGANLLIWCTMVFLRCSRGFHLHQLSLLLSY
ncbi:TPA: hypothetical protein L7112_005146 [Klebsiella pneumoniae]|nr:hypothetical protein [Klebsiella pneumoniae]